MNLKKSNVIQANGVFVVGFDHILTLKEINALNPLRQLSSTEFVIGEKEAVTSDKKLTYRVSANSLWKASDNLLKQLDENIRETAWVRFSFRDSSAILPEALKKYALKAFDAKNQIATVLVPLSELENLLNDERIRFADVISVPKEDVVVNGLDLSSISVSASRKSFPEVNGNGIVLSLKEGKFNETDLDVLGKVISNTNNSADNGHANIMATLALGSGNSFIKGMGVAPEAKLISSDFSNLMPDELRQLVLNKISVQNHSYGVGIENFYGLEAAAYDQQVFEADTLVHVFSSGNRGTTSPDAGLYQGLKNTANLTGNFKQAKNVLVVGGVNVENVSEALSSRGPAYDGRVKPELVAPGEDGTSGAAALTSGVVALLQQKYHDQYLKMPSSALIKSILINSADDLGAPNVDYIYGFGKINALNALQALAENRFKKGTVGQGQDYVILLDVAAGTAALKTSLVWNDPSAAINSAVSLVNHLDFSLETPDGKILLPWVLSASAQPDSLLAAAVRKVDERNNAQQISLDQPLAGTYKLHISGTKVTQALQDFFVSYATTQNNFFQWTYPQKDDFIFAGANNTIRWQNTFSIQRGTLSASDDGINWTEIDGSVDLTKGFYSWKSPDKLSRALLKMQIGTQSFISPSFVVSPVPELKIGYSCADGILFHWKTQASAQVYHLYNLADNRLKMIQTVNDTLSFVPQKDIQSPYFAVSADGKDFSGLKSYTIDYRSQALACYVVNFLGNPSAGEIVLNLNLGSTYKLKTIQWEKEISKDVFQTFKQTTSINNQLAYTATDPSPRKGIQRYRATFITSDDVKIRSDIIAVNFLKEDAYVLYPNPVETDLNVLSGGFDDYTLMVYNLIGQKVFEDRGNGQKKFNLSKLMPGIYISVISKDGKIQEKQKLIKL